MSATARVAGSPDRRPGTGPVRTARAGTHRTGTLRTGVHRTGVVRGGAGRAGAASGATQRSVGHRATPTTTPSRNHPSRGVPTRPDLRVVPSGAARARGRQGRSRRLPLVLLALALLIGTTLSLLVLNTAIAVDSLRATSLRQQNDHREQELQRLQQEVIDGSSVQKLAGDAAKAGLVPAGTAGYLVVEPDGTSTLRGTPTPATAPSTAPSPTGGN